MSRVWTDNLKRRENKWLRHIMKFNVLYIVMYIYMSTYLTSSWKCVN